MRGNDGQIFMYDVTDRRSRTDFVDYNDWYGRAAGFDKPCLVVSSKNDQKKRAVQEGEGQALAAKGDRRGYAALNLVDDEGVDELVTQLARIFSQDPNVNVMSWKKASEATLQWSADKIAEKMSGIGLGATVAKSYRALAIIPSNSSGVLEKFSEMLFPSSFLLVQADDCWTCEEMIDKENALLESEKTAAVSGTDDAAGSSSEGGTTVLRPSRPPIIAIIVPPSAPERVLREATGWLMATHPFDRYEHTILRINQNPALILTHTLFPPGLVLVLTLVPCLNITLKQTYPCMIFSLPLYDIFTTPV